MNFYVVASTVIALSGGTVLVSLVVEALPEATPALRASACVSCSMRSSYEKVVLICREIASVMALGRHFLATT